VWDWIKEKLRRLWEPVKRFFTERKWYLLMPAGLAVGGTIGWIGLSLGGIWADVCIGLAAGLVPSFPVRFVDVCVGIVTGVGAALLWHFVPVLGFALVCVQGVVFVTELCDYLEMELRAQETRV
jgi:hypothetical protein